MSFGADSQPGPTQLDWAEKWSADGYNGKPQKDCSGGEGMSGNTDLNNLLSMLEDLTQSGVWLTEVQHIINSWTLAGFIPMKHHGLVIRTSASTCFSLDFGRKGIVWDVFPMEPLLPEGTTFEQRFPIHRAYSDPARVEQYCSQNEEFSFFGNDCEKFAEGLLQEMGCRDDVEYTTTVDEDLAGFDEFVKHHHQPKANVCVAPWMGG